MSQLHLLFLSTERGVLVITILQGKDMAAMDSNGESNSFDRKDDGKVKYFSET